MKLAEQWAKVNTEHAGVAASPQEPTVFFTGKPYVDGLGYVFKYRNYNPELCRWQSADPSGFPDGANNQIYAPVPTSEIDPTGLTVLRSALTLTVTPQQCGVPNEFPYTLFSNLTFTIHLQGTGVGSVSSPTHLPDISNESTTVTGTTARTYEDPSGVLFNATYSVTIAAPVLVSSNTFEDLKTGYTYEANTYSVDVYGNLTGTFFGVSDTTSTLVGSYAMFLTDVGE